MRTPESPALTAPGEGARGLRFFSLPLGLGLGRVRAARSRGIVVGLGLGLVVLIGAADYVTGYEVRLAVLQLIPIALVTWLAGRGPGLAASGVAATLWVIAFGSSHNYSHDFYTWPLRAIAIDFIHAA